MTIIRILQIRKLRYKEHWGLITCLCFQLLGGRAIRTGLEMAVWLFAGNYKL